MRLSTFRFSTTTRPIGASAGAMAATMIAGALALTVAGWIRVPMWPVPMTMQTFAVLMLGAGAGTWLAPAAVILLLLAAAAGLPVLAGGHALALASPTVGYLVGYIPAAAWVGYAARRDWLRAWSVLPVMLLAEVLVFLPGVTWLWLGVLHDAKAALAGGLMPFIPGEAAKIALAWALLSLRARHSVAR